MIDCGADNRACEERCIEASDPDAFEQFISYNDCLREAECADVNYACRRSSCQMEGLACFDAYSIPNGALTCRQFDGCLSACLDGDAACVNMCIERASPQGFNAHVVLASCQRDAVAGAVCQAEQIACF